MPDSPSLPPDPPPQSRRASLLGKATEIAAAVLSALAATLVTNWARESWGYLVGFAVFLACFMLCFGLLTWAIPSMRRDVKRRPRPPRFSNRIKGHYHSD